MRKNNKTAFTLIELLITMTLFFLISILTYAPYNFYQKKLAVKTAGKQISQTILRAKNMALNGVVHYDENRSIWVYFDTSNTNNTQVQILSYTHDIESSNINRVLWNGVELIETTKLEPWMKLTSVWNKPNMLFFFDAITGKVSYYSWNGNQREGYIDNLWENSLKQVPISYQYRDATSSNLKWTISYFSETNIINY